MSDSKQFSREQIDKITYSVQMTGQEQRAIVRQHLYALHDRDGGVFYKVGLHHELVQLYESNKISETELHAIEHAFFG